jgi:hypothetical protein
MDIVKQDSIIKGRSHNVGSFPPHMLPREDKNSHKVFVNKKRKIAEVHQDISGKEANFKAKVQVDTRSKYVVLIFDGTKYKMIPVD